VTTAVDSKVLVTGTTVARASVYDRWEFSGGDELGGGPGVLLKMQGRLDTVEEAVVVNRVNGAGDGGKALADDGGFGEEDLVGRGDDLYTDDIGMIENDVIIHEKRAGDQRRSKHSKETTHHLSSL
jgi:hypothetical protein